MKHIHLFLLWILCLYTPVKSIAQYNISKNRIWAISRYAGLDFSNGNPEVIATKFNSTESCASVSGGENSRLLFYTDGNRVWDSLHNLMPEGYNLNNNQGIGTVTQGALIVPKPGTSNIYHLFSIGSGLSNSLYNNMVNMTLNNGLGDIDINDASNGLILDDALSEKMIAVAGCNNNIWLLVRPLTTPSVFKAYEITSTGINTTPVISSVSFPAVGFGAMKISPVRNKLVECSNSFRLYDFDPATGIVNNGQTLDEATSVDSYYGAAFSPNGSKVYASSTEDGEIYQFDLEAVNPSLSKILVGYGGPIKQDLKLGPDEKIYFCSSIGYDLNNMPVGGRYMGRINNPDNPGISCNFQDSITALQFADTLRIDSGLPNEVWTASISGTHFSQVVSDTVICNYDNVALYALNPGFDYNWDNGTTDSMRIITAAGIYWLTYNDHFCNSYTDTYKVHGVTLLPLEIISDNGLLTTSNNYDTYQWYKDDILLTNETAATLLPSGFGWYSVKVGNNSGCTDSVGYEVTNGTAIKNAPSTFDNITLYPNPAINTIFINTPTNLNIGLYTIEGRCIKSFKHTRHINISTIKAGFYLLRLEDEKGRFIKMTKVIKQ